jgi:hypothetical protein
MKQLIGLVIGLSVFQVNAQVPVLKTDIVANQVLINLGVADISLSQDFDDGRDSEKIKTNVSAKEVGLAVSGSQNGRITPILSADVSLLSADDDSQDSTHYDVYVGFALEGLVKKHLFLINYEDYSDKDTQGAIGVMGIFKSTPSITSNSEFEIITELALQETTDTVSGGHEFSVGLNAKLPLSSQLYLTSGAEIGIESDLEYASGATRDAKPSLNANLGLNLQPNNNLSISAGFSTYLQGFEYYQADGDYVLSELRTGVGFLFEVQVGI